MLLCSTEKKIYGCQLPPGVGDGNDSEVCSQFSSATR